MKPDYSRRPPVSDLSPHRWSGAVTWREAAELREALFDRLEAPQCTGVYLDVRDVTYIDNSGVALLTRRHVLSDVQVTRRTLTRGHAEAPRGRLSRLRSTPLAVLGGAV
jgi:ABC-type transporter Mla MlaB component